MATPIHQHSFEDLLERVRSGDQSAAAELHGRYFGRLIQLARSRLTPKLERRVDPEDVVQSACRSFFRRILDGRYHVEEEEQLWHLLAAITASKARKAVRRHTSAKRSVISEESTAKSLAMEHLTPVATAQVPTPEEATILIEETERMMTRLTPLQRQMVQTHLQGLNDSDFSVAKHGDVVTNSGWFSERSANYLASGLPVITQDTGFSQNLPTGRGLFAFSDADEAAKQIEEVNGDLAIHGRAAREVAESCFRADSGLSDLLEAVSMTTRPEQAS